MSFITGKHIERRTFLRGAGATVALPLLDAMLPAGAIGRTAAELSKPRLIAMEQSHGAAGCSQWGATQNLWNPAKIGRDFDMTALVDGHTTSKDMTLLAKRISVSQTDEIKSMQRWLEAHGQSVPGEHAHHMMMAEGHLMPGMLTEAEMSQLAAAKGVAFDRLFLQFMIKHHEGALVMVKELFASVGAAQDANVFAFASDVDADQRMEISRMRAMLTSR